MSFAEAVARGEFGVREARREEVRACRMVLGEITCGECRFVAALSGGLVIGAAAIVVGGKFLEHGIGVVDVHVIPPCRGFGVGRALVEGVVRLAGSMGLTGVEALKWVGAGSVGMKVWGRLGFTPVQWRYEYRGELAHSLEVVQPLVGRLRERGKVPGEARVVSLAEADVRAVAELHARYLGGTVEALVPMMRGEGAEAFDVGSSRVALLGDRVVGLSLGRPSPVEGEVYEYDSVVADPEVRQAWVVPWLRMEHCAAAMATGCRELKYFALSQHLDTQHAGERFGAVLTSTTARMRRACCGSGYSGGESTARGSRANLRC